MARRSAAPRGVANAQGGRTPRASGGARTMSCHSGSPWRSYQATYSSTMGRVAGCRVTSSTSPSPTIHTRRPSRRASRYSAPLLTRRVSSPRGVVQRRGVVELVELDHLALPEAPEVGLGRVHHAAGGAVLPRRRAAHRHPVAVRDEGAGLVVDHLPLAQEPVEVALEVGLRAHLAGELGAGAAVGQGPHADIVRHEIEPGLDAVALRLVPLPVGVLQPRHVLSGTAHSATSAVWFGAPRPRSFPPRIGGSRRISYPNGPSHA